VGSRIIQHSRSPGSELLEPSPHHMRQHVRNRQLCVFAGHVLFHFSVLNTALRRHHLLNEGRTSHNKRGRLPVDTEHSDTPPILHGP
jgi:hypothetical protein